MARATRSSTQQDQETDKQSDSTVAASRGKATSKKRKRTSIVENSDQPAAKQLRSGDVSIKEEGRSQEPDGLSGIDKPSELQNAGDVPITDDDAQKILDILEMIDTQGLLDRVFPLPSNSGEASSSQPTSHSFRTLLKESTQHTLRVLRSAVQNLFPISSHPRSRPSTPAVQQLNFCNLALSLLDQASFHSVPVPLTLETILPAASHIHDATNDADTISNVKATSITKPPSHPTESSPVLAFKRKYALMQKLTSGEWWTSINSDFGQSVDGKALKDLPTAHAELVAILPSPSTSIPDLAVPIPTLGSYTKKSPGPKARPMGPRRTSCGSFLDYGPYTSFAPSFEGEGVEVGRMALGETIWRWEERRAEMLMFKATSIKVDETIPEDTVMDDVQEVSMDGVPEVLSNKDLARATEEGLEGLLSPDEVAVIKAALGTLELEEAVNELLERNKRALERLGELQRLRIGSEDGGSNQVEEGSEEWDIAQGILDSLTVLASLRPRSSKDTAERPPLIPSTNILRKLHLTLPIASTQGWHGTLPPTRPLALRDDTTIHIKSGIIIPHTEPTAPPAANAAPANATTTPHPGYPYPGYSTGQPYRGTYPQQQYKPGQAYYPGAQPQGQAPAAGQTSATQYYPNQQYGQGQFQYSPYYYAQGQATNTGANTSSRGTPQPAGATSTTYGGGYHNYAAPQAAQRAVANTVVTAAAVTAKPYQQGVNGQAPPTLPPHLRNATWSGGVSQPGTPGGTSSGYQQFGQYQPSTPTR